MYQVRTVFMTEQNEVRHNCSDDPDCYATSDFDRFDLAVAEAWRIYNRMTRQLEEDLKATVDVVDTTTDTVVWERTACRWPLSSNSKHETPKQEPMPRSHKSTWGLHEDPQLKHDIKHRHSPAHDWIGLSFLTAFTNAFGLEPRTRTPVSKPQHQSKNKRA
jgi:hypothetical protein